MLEIVGHLDNAIGILSFIFSLIAALFSYQVRQQAKRNNDLIKVVIWSEQNQVVLFDNLRRVES